MTRYGVKEMFKRQILKVFMAYAVEREELEVNYKNEIYCHYRWVFVCLLCGTPYYGDRDKYQNQNNFRGLIDHFRDKHEEWLVAYWCYKQRKEYTIESKIKLHPLKPWHDPESLYCDKEFLEELLSKEVAEGNECKG